MDTWESGVFFPDFCGKGEVSEWMGWDREGFFWVLEESGDGVGFGDGVVVGVICRSKVCMVCFSRE